MSKKEEKVEKVEEAEVAESTDKNVITDVLEEYFYDKEEDREKVKRTYMNGKKKLREEISNH